VILPGGRFQVFVATKPVDFRKGMDSLAAVVQERLRLDPFSGACSCSAPSAPTG
jgi:transposase